ncbi:PASTA domain-containing protein [Niabella ginsengisoli]|uniref:PASTA domain-containing protein n=1 Tax=Niabella ginsengisoli TaxID=522298 RepID=A0ABS9SKJ6_9BACT|nr:PASTA domain-containing protein [Niabella ginsengisoli]MCH5598825.1 PASTA domain-containing protein [Niabella ginsengisoli]
MFRFITKKPLWINILVGVLLAILLFVGVISSLGWFTNHDDAKTVPGVTGKSLAEAEKILNDAGFTVEIQDSLYFDTLSPMQVIRQVPDEMEVVKSSRTVYLTYNRALPPQIEMPNIVGYSFRNATMVLENAGLKVGDTTFRPDFAKNSVLEQLYKGVTIQPGAKIAMGSKIDLVIGSQLSTSAYAIPNLIGLTTTQARLLLESKGIMLASIIPNPDVRDTTNAYVYRQSPNRFDDQGNIISIRAGQVMDVWVSVSAPVIDSLGIEGSGNADSLSENE